MGGKPGGNGADNLAVNPMRRSIAGKGAASSVAYSNGMLAIGDPTSNDFSLYASDES